MIYDELLHKWINGELTPQEQKTFEQRPEYESLVALYKNTAHLTTPDFNQSAMLQQIIKQPKTSTQTSTKKQNVVSIFKWQRYVAAAAVFLLIGLFFWYQTDNYTVHETAQGETYKGTLPDGSTFVLNAASSLTYDADKWQTNRELQLQGEAFFEVKKGERFRVITPNGMVQVLGTVFNVRARQQMLEVSCQEGQVAVLDLADKTLQLLSAKEALRIENQQVVEKWRTGDNENWTGGIYRFRKVSVATVLAEIERQFGVNIDSKNVNTNDIINCSFQRKDIELALRSCLTSVGIQYKINGKQVVLSTVE